MVDLRVENEDLTEDGSRRAYTNPDGCQATVAVGSDGSYVMLDIPDLWMFECEPDPHNNGFGDSYDLPPGIYRVTYSFTPHLDLETSCIDDWEFDPARAVCLWADSDGWFKRLLRAMGFFKHNVL